MLTRRILPVDTDLAEKANAFYDRLEEASGVMDKLSDDMFEFLRAIPLRGHAIKAYATDSPNELRNVLTSAIGRLGFIDSPTEPRQREGGQEGQS